MALVVPAWAGIVSAIILQRLFGAPSLSPLDWGLIFLASIFSGLVIGELENAVVGFFATLVLSGVIVGVVLALPVTLGLTGPLLEQPAEEKALTNVFQALFPFTLVFVLAGGILGSMLAERLDLN